MRYQLRHAAGMYWLLDTKQPGVPYKSPLPLNEAGAGIFRMMQEGMGKDQIAAALCEEYQMPQSVILPDVEEFQKQLERYGIKEVKE